MNALTTQVTGLRPQLFRPPYGVMNPNLKKAIEKGNFTPVGWSIRSYDTLINNPETLRKRVRRMFHPGPSSYSMIPAP
jgi:peptidoglycan/xylan/chitin deacetylase (PgdA/CDA1 family)